MDLMEYAMRNDLMDNDLYEVLHRRSIRELDNSNDTQVQRFRYLKQRYLASLLPRPDRAQRAPPPQPEPVQGQGENVETVRKGKRTSSAAFQEQDQQEVERSGPTKPVKRTRAEGGAGRG